MTVIDGTFDPDDKELILDALVLGAERAFGGDSLDPDEAAAVRAFYDPIAEYLSLQQEDIAAVLRASQIDNAEGDALDLLAALIGVVRKPAAPSSTRLQFQRDSPTSTTYTIPSGTTVQTNETDPVEFDTDTSAELKYIDGFEDGNITEYDGDTGNFSVQTTTVHTGSNALKSDATAAVLFSASDTVPQGSVAHFRQYLDAGSVGGTLFGVQDTNNYYSAIVDEASGEIRIELTESGSTSTLGTPTSVSVPSGSWLHGKLDWGNEGRITFTLYDSNDSELASVEVTESVQTFESGGIGYESGNATGNKYWDEFTMEAVGVDATATSDGVETNVGASTLTVLAESVSGIDSVTNPEGSSGGRDKEPDDDFRDRAKQELSEGMRATLPALITQLLSIDETQSVTVIDNDTASADGDGRPSHSFEAVVEAPSDIYEDIAEVILDTKAAGDTSVGGYAGTKITKTVELSNGQTKDIDFSEPTTVQIYVDCDLTKTSTYAGDDEVRDNIVQYTGGVLSSGDSTGGSLGSGDDVIYNQVLEAVMDVQGVYDVTNLEVDTDATPTGTSNISIADSENSTADATDSSLDISSSDA